MFEKYKLTFTKGANMVQSGFGERIAFEKKN